MAYPEFVRRLPGLYVDLGYGASPITSVETLHRLRRLNPRIRVLGVEIDPQRVAEAEAYTAPGLEFRVGGFNIPLRWGEQVSVIRAFNVLRQYDESAVAEALTVMATTLTEGGLIIEGTSDPLGRLLTFNLYQKAEGLRRLNFVLAPSLHANFTPRQFQAVLPKNFIHHAEPGGAIDEFFTAWQVAWQAARSHGANPREVFYHSALHLSARYGYEFDRRPALLKRGFLCLGAGWPGHV